MTHRLSRTVALIAAAVLLLSAAAIAVPMTASAASTVTGNPLAGNGGFTVMSTGDMVLSNLETEGSVAAGGTISSNSASAYALIHQAAGNGSYSLPQYGAGGPYVRLVTGGEFLFTPGHILRVTSGNATSADQQGIAIVGDASNAHVAARGSGVCFYPLGDSSCGSTTLEQSVYAETTAQAVDPAAFDALVPASGIADLKAWSDAITGSTLQNTVSVTSSVTGQGLGLTLTDHKINVWHVNASALPSSWKLEFLGGAQPSATSPLVVDITAGDNATVNLPAEVVGFGSTQNDAFAHYMLWNFSQSAGSTVNLQSDGVVPGSVLAPYSRLVTPAGKKTLIEGQISAAGVSLNNDGEVHHYGFSVNFTRTTTTPTFGGFSVKKVIAGDVTAVPSGTDFTVSYYYDGSTTPAGTLTVDSDGSVVNGPTNIPTGTVVTFGETSIPTVPGGSWTGSPVFSPTSVTVGDGTVPAVTVTNTFTRTVTPTTPTIASVAYVGTAANGAVSLASPTLTDHVTLDNLTVGSDYRLSGRLVSIAGGVISTVTTAGPLVVHAASSTETPGVSFTLTPAQITAYAGQKLYIFLVLADARGATLAEDSTTDARSAWFSATHEWVQLTSISSPTPTPTPTVPTETPTPTVTPTPSSTEVTDGPSKLAFTGVSIVTPLLIAAALAIVGVLLLVLRRRRTTHDRS